MYNYSTIFLLGEILGMRRKLDYAKFNKQNNILVYK